MPNIETLRFVQTTPKQLVETTTFDHVQSVRRQHYGRVFDRRNANEVRRFVEHDTPSSWVDPNLKAKPNERFARPKITAALDVGGRIVSFVYSVEHVAVPVNGSGQPSVGQRLKMASSLRRPAKAGAAVQYREILGSSDALVGALLYANAAQYDSLQPVDILQHDEDNELRQRLDSWGAHENSHAEEIRPFGNFTPRASLLHHRTYSQIGNLTASLLASPRVTVAADMVLSRCTTVAHAVTRS